MILSAGASTRKEFSNYRRKPCELYVCVVTSLKKLNVLKIDGVFKLQLLTFCFDLINNNLPAYFINMSSLLQPVIYHHNIRPKRNYSVARVKHVFAQKCMVFVFRIF